MTEYDRKELTNAFAETLNGTFVCSRVWDAWSVGTMTEDDFHPADEDKELIDDLIDIVFRMSEPDLTQKNKRPVRNTYIAIARAISNDNYLKMSSSDFSKKVIAYGGEVGLDFLIKLHEKLVQEG